MEEKAKKERKKEEEEEGEEENREKKGLVGLGLHPDFCFVFVGLGLI